MAGPIHCPLETFNGQIALFKEIGRDHIDGDLSQKTTTFMGRVLSNVFLKSSHNMAVKNLIASIKETPGFGDKYATQARSLLRSAVDQGKPLTGRVAAKVLQDVQIARSEDLARSTNISINIDTAFSDHSQEFNEILDTTIKAKFHEAGEAHFPPGDRRRLISDMKDSFKKDHTDRSPSLEMMKTEFVRSVTHLCNQKLDSLCDGLAGHGKAALLEKIDARLKGMAIEVSLNDNLVSLAGETLTDAIHHKAHNQDHMINSDDARTCLDKVVDDICRGFAAVKESGLDDATCLRINTLLAEGVNVLPSKDLGLSLCQAVASGACQELLKGLTGNFDSNDHLFELSSTFFDRVEQSAVDSGTGLAREKMDTPEMGGLHRGITLLTAQVEQPVSRATMAGVRNFLDRAGQLVRGSDADHPGPDIQRLDLFRTMVADSFRLPKEGNTKDFMAAHPQVAQGAAGLVNQIFDKILTPFQAGALELIEQSCANGMGLPLAAEVVPGQDGRAMLSCRTTATLDPQRFLESFSASTTVSRGRIKQTNMTEQFVADLARAEVRFNTPRGRVVFTQQEACDVEEKKTAPGILSQKLTDTCRGNPNEAFALSVLLNQQFPGSVGEPFTRLSLLALTGGGGVVVGAGLEHGSYDVTSHGDGKYTIAYSARAQQEMLTGGSLDDRDVPVQMIQSQGHDMRLGLDFTYTVDLAGVGKDASEVELARLVQFDRAPDVSLEFVNKE